MRIAIVGSRSFKNLELVDKYLLSEYDRVYAHANDFFEVITGGAEGVDKRAMDWCREHKIFCQVIRPLSKEPISYLFRNVEILAKADRVVAFWDTKSN